jgi:hypothetical protein
MVSNNNKLSTPNIIVIIHQEQNHRTRGITKNAIPQHKKQAEQAGHNPGKTCGIGGAFPSNDQWH